MNEYKKEDIRNIHYNNKNEIQFEYGGQVHHYRMENLKEVFINCWNLQQENQKYKEVIDKINHYIEKQTRMYGLSMPIELGTHLDNILSILKEVSE